jgi:uncharacterized protein
MPRRPERGGIAGVGLVTGPHTRPGPQVPCLYEVRIRHGRQAPVYNTFRHGSYMWLFDLDDPPRLPGLLRPLARYRSRDHIDVRAALEQSGMDAGRILVLTNLRMFGYVFNPISIYWCFDPIGRLVAHVAEVHNTYGGRHAYVLPLDTDSVGRDLDSVVSKAMYVSPFHPVDGIYRIRIGPPAETLRVSVVLERPDSKPFRAGLAGSRRQPSVASLWRCFLRYPVAPLRGRALIQFQGLRLWRRRLEVQPR